MTLILLILTTLLLCASCDPVTDNKRSYDALKGIYIFNHPPTIEEYNPIDEEVTQAENSYYKTRVIKEINNSTSEDSSTTHNNLSMETIQEQLEDDLPSTKFGPKRRAGDSVHTSTESIKKDLKSVNIDDDDIQINKGYSVRKTLVQKRIRQNSFAQNSKLEKPTNIYTTTLKPAITTRVIKKTNKSTASPDELTTGHNLSVEKIQEQSRVDLSATRFQSKGRAFSGIDTSTQRLQKDRKNENVDDGDINVSKRYSAGKTLGQKQIVQQSDNNEKKIAQNIDLEKPKNTYTTTLKPTSTTLKQIPQAPKGVNPNNQKERRQRDPVVPIVESENYVYSHNGNFHYSYVGGDGTQASEQGELKVFDDKTAGESVVGSFSYTDKDGNDFSLSYTADENGYRPVGAHLPTPPPIPPAIARALLYLSTKTPTESTTKI